MIKKGLLLIAVCFGILLSGACYHHPWDHDGHHHHGGGVHGSGQVMEETRQVGAFDSVKIKGSFRVFFNKDGGGGVRLVGEDNILPIISTYVENGVLVIEPERSYSTDIGVKAYLSMDAVRGFTIEGAGHVTGEGSFDTDALFLEIFGAGKIEMNVSASTVSTTIEGTGHVELGGRADSHVITIDGAGKLEAEGFEVKNYDITVNGAGTCRIFVTRVLEAVINGAGMVYYKGDPHTINTQVSGVGKVTKI